MIPNQNCEIFASILFFLLAKICCYFHIKTTTFMSKHHSRLTSIPERNEIEEEAQKKWVPKKKHEVLKAKYKCLKKLFQIYDASLLGYLPETEQSDHVDDEESNHRRKKRSYRTNTDAHVGTSEEINVDNIEPAELSDQSTVLTGKNQVNCGSSIDRSSDNSYRYQMTQVSNLNLQGCNCASNHQDMPKAPFKTGTKRPTRFQSFMQRAFGLRVEKICPHNCSSNIYAISDNIINYRSNSKRRRKGFRFRRIKCPKRVHSESAIHDLKSPAILNYMQSVQRNCLLDTTPRKCPITGCNVMLYGTILASYIGFGAEPAHLVTASVMSAPAAICYAKLLLPETKRSLTAVDNIRPIVSEDRSALSAATRGATNGIALILNIVANLVAFVAFIAFVNGVLGYAGDLLGNPGLNLEWILGKVFIPLCWIMGVPWEECESVGSLIGLKTVVNEFVAYQRMGEMKAQGLLSARGELIATYALCGFTNPASAGILIGAFAAMAPNQRETLSSTAVRAFFCGCGICFMTACIAALLMPEGSFG